MKKQEMAKASGARRLAGDIMPLDRAGLPGVASVSMTMMSLLRSSRAWPSSCGFGGESQMR